MTSRAGLILIPGLALLLSGCVAETVRKARPRKGTVKEIGYVDLGGGEVRYSLDGWGWFVKGRRRAARALMSHVCGKLKPVVTEEFDREDADVPYSQDDIAATMDRGAEHFTVARYLHMVFECAYSSTAPVRGEPPKGLPPPPRPQVSVSPPGAENVRPPVPARPGAPPAPTVAVSSAPAPAQVPVSPPPAASAVAASSAPVLVPATSAAAPPPVVQFSSAPARPAITSSASGAPPPAAPPPAAVWSPFLSSWSPAQAPKPSTAAASVSVSTGPAVPEVRKP
jgi:hypothetical protein